MISKTTNLQNEPGIEITVISDDHGIVLDVDGVRYDLSASDAIFIGMDLVELGRRAKQ